MDFDPSLLALPDDTGSDTFNRYRYQAHVAFRFCLDCGLDGNVSSVVMEHLEDMALECSDHWRFCQIKTRDANRGPWRLSDLTGKGGILSKLYRTHDALKDAPATVELMVEGAIKQNDDIEKLTTYEGRCSDAIQSAVAKSLSLDEESCKAFLGRLRFSYGLPPRASIVADNLYLLMRRAAHLSGDMVCTVYLATVELVVHAMEAIAADCDWYDLASDDDVKSSRALQLYNKKRLTRGAFDDAFAPIRVLPLSLLKQSPANLEATTMMVRKLETGGAPDDLVESAKMLRANATLRRIEFATSSLYDPEELLKDIHTRLLVRIRTLRAKHMSGESPAVAIFDDLLSNLPTWAATVDPNGVFNGDPDLLLGELCDMSDRCIFDWGTVRA